MSSGQPFEHSQPHEPSFVASSRWLTAALADASESTAELSQSVGELSNALMYHAMVEFLIHDAAAYARNYLPHKTPGAKMVKVLRFPRFPTSDFLLPFRCPSHHHRARHHLIVLAVDIALITIVVLVVDIVSVLNMILLSSLAW